MKLFEGTIASVKNMFGITVKEKPVKGSLESIAIPYEGGDTASSGGGQMGFSTNLFEVPTSDVELIKAYRNISLTADVDRALNEIRNEIFIFDANDKKAIDISFSETIKNKKLSKALMDKISAEFDTIYQLLDFGKKGINLFDRWYIDGKLVLHKIVDKTRLKDGIQRIIRIDPLKIKKIVQYPEADTNGVYDLNKIITYYIYSDTADVHSIKTTKHLVISKDAIAYIDSGIYDYNTGAVLSNLWKTIVPYNNMKLMEEALLVYRVVRSPERRAFYINVGNLNKPKAEQYMNEMMSRFKNKLVYDTKTGTTVDRKSILSMVEDYWIPRRDDGKGTEIVPLPGATNLGSVDDVEIFKKKFMESINVPSARFKDDAPSFTFGRSAEISRDEYRFKKFLDRLRNGFIVIFEDLLKTQLILKNIIVDADWDDIKKSLVWVYAEDNNFVQWKEAELLNSQIESMTAADPLVNKYFTKAWAMKKILHMSDEEIQEEQDAIKKELEAMPKVDENGNPVVEPQTSQDETSTEEDDSSASNSN